MKNSVVATSPTETIFPIRISAIIPLFNEEKGISLVVHQLLKHPLIGEIICVNDGSTDNSIGILKQFGSLIKIISLTKNRGKGYAMSQGIQKARGDIVAFFDADLTNLTIKHIDSLLNPIIEKKARVVLGYPTGGHFPSLFIDVTGERAYYREDLLPYLKKIETTTRFSVEYYLNSLYEKEDIQKVPLRNLVHLYKHEKYKAHLAVKETVKDIIAITQQISKREHLLPVELQTLSAFTTTLKNLNSFKDLKEAIYGIRNSKIKGYLRKALHYFIEYN